MEDLIAMTELCDIDNRDVDSIVAPSDISWFTDSNDDHNDVTTDDVTTAVANGKPVVMTCHQQAPMRYLRLIRALLNFACLIQKITQPF